MKDCIICDIPNDSKSVEHIVSESLGNKDYVMEKSRICEICNNRFSKFEGKALANSIFAMERARLGIKTKKGRTTKGKIKEISVEGSKSFQKDLITIKGLNQENFRDFDPINRTGYLIVHPFDKSEVATSKLLLKVGIESIFTSQKKVYKNNNFSDLKDYLKTASNKDWPFVTTDKELHDFIDVVKFTEKYNLGKKRIVLKYLQKDDKSLLFKFKYGGITMVVNLLNRSLGWIEEYNNHGFNFSVYPIHLKEKLPPTQ